MGQMLYRDSEESRKQIIAGLDEYRRLQAEKRIRQSVARDINEWEQDWGGPCPWREPDPEMDKLRRAAGLKEKNPPPWYKRIARFYNENWETMFDGVGASILVLAMISLVLLVFINVGRTTGWWGGW